MKILRYAAVALLFLLAGRSAALADQPVTLGSGKSIEIIAIGPMQSTHGWSALMLKYKTTTPQSNLPALRQEADEVWDRFVIDVEQAGYETAIISANQPEEGSFIKTNSSYNFVFEKKNGAWQTLDGEKGKPLKLDENTIKEFMSRLDNDYDHNEINAFILHFAKDWTGTFRSNKGNPETIDRMKFAAGTHQTMSMTKNFQHHRTITKITISSDGSSAQVESNETEAGLVNGKSTDVTEHSVDTIEVRDASILVTKSTSDSEDVNKK